MIQLWEQEQFVVNRIINLNTRDDGSDEFNQLISSLHQALAVIRSAMFLERISDALNDVVRQGAPINVERR